MIDRKARDILAENFRHLIAGQITNDQFEDRLIRSEDVGVTEVFIAVRGHFTMISRNTN